MLFRSQQKSFGPQASAWGPSFKKVEGLTKQALRARIILGTPPLGSQPVIIDFGFCYVDRPGVVRAVNTLLGLSISTAIGLPISKSRSEGPDAETCFPLFHPLPQGVADHLLHGGVPFAGNRCIVSQNRWICQTKEAPGHLPGGSFYLQINP